MTEGRLLWCDAEANARLLSTREGVAGVAEKARQAGVNTLIVDVKPLSGEVLYASRLAPRLGDVNGFPYPDFDPLAAMIEEGHARGLAVHVGINIFSEGHRIWGRGPGFDRTDWQVTMCEAVRTVRFTGGEIEVGLVDPWAVPEGAPAIYTRKSGETLSREPDRRYYIVDGDCTARLAEGDVRVPAVGCVISVPEGVEIVDRVEFAARHVFRPASESAIPSWGLFVNPIGPAREHELAIIREIAENYEVDGITFDRMRYPNLYADFGAESRHAFEAWLGKGSLHWPEDVFTISDLPWMPPAPGPFYKEWLEWRALQIRDFAEGAVRAARDARPEVKVGVYVGSWYDSYYDVGVNWGSRECRAGLPWMTPSYNRTGYAELFDYICTGCYYPTPTKAEARAKGCSEGATVEGACETSRRAIRDAAPVYGSIYLRDYAGNPSGFERAVSTARNNSDGVMLFDLVYLEEYGWWPGLAHLFEEKA
ncbi:MAG: alpha amylase family protein [Armatimonadota bacterium]